MLEQILILCSSFWRIFSYCIDYFFFSIILYPREHSYEIPEKRLRDSDVPKLHNFNAVLPNNSSFCVRSKYVNIDDCLLYYFNITLV